MLHMSLHLSNADGLLLHGLMDASAVVLPNAVKLVNAADTAICQNQRASVQLPLTAILNNE